MTMTAGRLLKACAAALPAAVLATFAVLGVPAAASADEASAKKLLKAMSDYMASQKVFSADYDSSIEIITKDNQKLMLAGSGSMTLSRPEKLRVTRSAGFADTEMVFDGKTITILGKNANLYTQIDAPGTIDNLVDLLRDKYQRPVPGADLILANLYDTLMSDVVEAIDLGSGVIGGVECDHLAFRTPEVDWQIWIAQGTQPYPCRYIITSKHVALQPQFSIQIKEWKTGAAVIPDDFKFKAPPNARKIELKDLTGDDLPKHFTTGGAR